jgi:hypothetical protein
MSSVRVSVDETNKWWYAGHDQYSAFLWCVSYYNCSNNYYYIILSILSVSDQSARAVAMHS